MTLSPADFIDSFLQGEPFDDHLCELGLAIWDHYIAELPSLAGPNCLEIAPQDVAVDLELPIGSFMVEALAAVLDAASEINGTNRLALLQAALGEFGLKTPAVAEQEAG